MSFPSQKQRNFLLLIATAIIFVTPIAALTLGVVQWTIDTAIEKTHKQFCPFACVPTSSLPKAITDADARELIHCSQCLPPRYLSCYPTLFAHLDLKRRYQWNASPSGILAQEMNSDALIREDLKLLVRALFMRSLSNDQLAVAIAKKYIAPGRSYSQAIADEVHRLIESYRSQRAMSELLAEVASTQEIGDQLIIPEDRPIYFPEAAAFVGQYITGLYAKRLREGPNRTSESDVAEVVSLLVDAYQATLEGEKGVPSAPQSLIYFNPHLELTADDLAFYNSVDTLAVLRLCVFYADWLELQCWLAQQVSPPNADIIIKNTAAIIQHIEALQRTTSKETIPDVFLIHLTITDLEFRVCLLRNTYKSGIQEPEAEAIIKPATAQQMAKDVLQFILASMRQEEPGTLDPLDAMGALAYMRSFSAHLENAWSSDQFDQLVREAH